MNSADRSAPRCRTWVRATMFPATPSSTRCILSMVSDIAVYHCPGAFFALMFRAPPARSRRLVSMT